jgi:hypothetical protein
MQRSSVTTASIRRLLLQHFRGKDNKSRYRLGTPVVHPLEGAMDPASPRDIARLLQTRGPGEAALSGERNSPARRELSERAPHHIARVRPGLSLHITVAARAR